MGVKIFLADNEPIDKALRRFRKAVERDLTHGQMYRHFYYEKPAAKRRRKRFGKRIRARRAILHAQLAGELPCDSLRDTINKFWKKTGKQ